MLRLGAVREKERFTALLKEWKQIVQREENDRSFLSSPPKANDYRSICGTYRALELFQRQTGKEFSLSAWQVRVFNIHTDVPLLLAENGKQ